MFNTENTIGFTQDDCNLLNRAVNVLMAIGFNEKSACDIVNNNWTQGDNSLESLVNNNTSGVYVCVNDAGNNQLDIIVWNNESDSINDNGSKAIARFLINDNI